MRTKYFFFAFNFFAVVRVVCFLIVMVFLFFLNFLSAASWISYPFASLTFFHLISTDFFLPFTDLMDVAFDAVTVFCGVSELAGVCVVSVPSVVCDGAGVTGAGVPVVPCDGFDGVGGSEGVTGVVDGSTSVSYTHLDVYKRQVQIS